MHNAAVFRELFIYAELALICQKDEYHLLGDSAYPILTYLMTPYEDNGRLTSRQKQFNKRLCGTRVLIENAFGLLIQRFRQLIRCDFQSVAKTSIFVLCCCVLHNLCIEADDTESFDDAIGNDNQEHNDQEQQSSQSGLKHMSMIDELDNLKEIEFLNSFHNN